MKSKKIVRTMTKKHKAAVSCLNSFSKFLISCSCEDNLILVYDYQRQEVDQEIRLQQDTVSGLPTVVNMFKDSASGADLLLIGTTSGKVLIYDLQLKQFGHEIKTGQDVGSSFQMKPGFRICQFAKSKQQDMQSLSCNVFAVVSECGQIKLIDVAVCSGSESAGYRLQFKELVEL